MQATKVPSETAYTNISKMSYLKTRQRNNNCEYWEIC